MSQIRHLPCAIFIFAVLCLAMVPRAFCETRRFLQEQGGDTEGGAEDALPVAEEGTQSDGLGSAEAAPADDAGGDPAFEGEGSDQPTTGKSDSSEVETEAPKGKDVKADSADGSEKVPAAGEASADGAAGEKQKDGGVDGGVRPKKKR